MSNEEILEIINSLENITTGPSSIPLRMLSVIPDLIILPLAYIINMSILTGVYPDLIKIVKVIPIHKDGSTINLLSIWLNNGKTDSIIISLKNITYCTITNLALEKTTQPFMHWCK